jgi:hypothetical protein
MAIKQISVFLDNGPGRIAEVTTVLAKAGVNLRAISIADTADFGILRLVVDKEDAAQAALTKAGFTIRSSDVVAIEVQDQPGALAGVMALFQRFQVNIEYLYASLEGTEGHAVVIFKLQDYNEGLKIIKEHHIKLADSF